MLWMKKQRPWYWTAIVVLIVLRFVYGVARFFMNSVDRHAGRQESKSKNKRITLLASRFFSS